MSSVIPIDEHELTTDHMTKQCNNFIEHVEDKIGNAKKPLFDGTDSNIVYYSAFGYTDNADGNVLSYGDKILDQKEVEVNEDYIEALDNYVGVKVLVPGKYYIPVLA